MGPHFFRDPDFQFKLIAFLCKDRNVLKECAYLLESDDFKPRKSESSDLWTIATAALEFWQKYREPIGGMLRSEMLDYARTMNFSDRDRVRLLDTVKSLQKNHTLVAASALVEKVLAYKKERLKAQAVEQLIELKERGELSDEKYLQVCMDGVDRFGASSYEADDYFAGLERRIEARGLSHNVKRPMFMIDPLDELISGIGRGQLGLWFGFTKVGKSLALIGTSVGYIIQGLNVLYFTLEDPMLDTESRFDANIAELPIKCLSELPKTLRIRFQRFGRLLRSKLKIVDGTGGEMTVHRMEEIWERERNRGFTADAVIIDYDDEIKPVQKQQERRFEFADIYRDLRQFAARRQVILWTAAQTGRQSENRKIISASTVAEDISKIRKVSLAIGIGQGEWGSRSRFLYVAAHRSDKQHVGCNIMSDPDRSVFYDRRATVQKLVEESTRGGDLEE